MPVLVPTFFIIWSSISVPLLYWVVAYKFVHQNRCFANFKLSYLQNCLRLKLNDHSFFFSWCPLSDEPKIKQFSVQCSVWKIDWPPCQKPWNKDIHLRDGRRREMLAQKSEDKKLNGWHSCRKFTSKLSQNLLWC